MNRRLTAWNTSMGNGGTKDGLNRLPPPKPRDPGVWFRLKLYWCRKFHRLHHQRFDALEMRTTIHCARCGASYVRQREMVWQCR